MESLPGDVIKAIEDLREHGLSQRKTTEMVMASRGSVKNYEPEGCETDDTLSPEDIDVDAVLSDDIDLEVALDPAYIPNVDNTSSREWSSADPDESPYMTDNEAESRLEEDYSGMDPGDFIENFFEDFEVGVKAQFIRIQKRRSDRRNGIPSPDKLKNDLSEMSSGVANGKEIDYIIDEYWAEAQRYLRHNQHRGITALSMDDSHGMQPQQTQNPQNPGPQWYTMPNGSQQYGMYVQAPSGGQTFVPRQPPNQMQGQMGMQQSPPQQGGTDPELRRELQQLRQEVKEARNDGQQSDTLTSALNEMGKYKEAMEKLDELNGGSSEADQMIAQLAQEIQSLKSQVSSPSQPTSSDPREAMLMEMVRKGEANASDAMDVMREMSGENDPQVRQKKIEKELELEKLKHQRNRAESIVEAVSGVADQIGEGFARVLSEKSGQGGQQPQQQPQQQPVQGAQQFPTQQNPVPTQQNPVPTQQNPQNQQPMAQQPNPPQQPEPQSQSVDEWTCNHCGATTDQDEDTVGVECGECDKSVLPCLQCHDPMEIPAKDAPTSYECPDCNMPITDVAPDDDLAICIHCSWDGPVEETNGEISVCENCGFTDYVERGSDSVEVDV